MHWPFPPAAYIEHDKELKKLVKRLQNEPLLAIDTESNSMYAYQERVCLVQLSTRTNDYILDPLRIADMSPLGTLLANPQIEKVFHAAEYDLMCLKRDYGFTVVNMFDTMIAARICGVKALGLNRLLAEYCGVEADKSHQRDDWGQRPISEEGLLYAQMDTHYLPELRDKLLDKLVESGRMEEAQETFLEASAVTPPEHHFDPDGYWRMAIPAGLNRRQSAILRELYLAREVIAQERDCPPYKVFTDKMILAIAEAGPRSSHELERVRGLPVVVAKRYSHEVMQAVDKGKRTQLPNRPRRAPDVDPIVAERFTALRDWRRERAEQRGVESDVIISKDTLWDLAFKAPTTIAEMQDISGLGPWRLATYGDELAVLIQRLRAEGL
ncbi:MAG: HRDC domain-containing protein [Chloroflexi bacterium]|nr:HRDC domain-containing protein [Chloroflexota bacterium]MCC6895777.1 ribonuclease D [Anaerolineae bacterium]